MPKDSPFKPLDETGQMIERPRSEHLLEIRYVSLRRPVPCEHCGSIRTRTYCTKPLIGVVRTRHHICKDCGGKFKTAVEEDPAQV